MSEIELGLKIILSDNLEEKFKKAKKLGFNNCQLDCWDQKLFTDKNAQIINEMKDKYKFNITAFWCGWSGPARWNFTEGPLTLGLVPEVYQFMRMKTLIKGSDFANKIGVNKIITHVGFIPENPNSNRYKQVLEAVKHVAEYCKENNQYFLFETGQETPVVLLRVIEDIKLNNLGINLDPANFLMYGKANPVDALDIIGEYVMGVHAKDGEYPTTGKELGQEKPIGEGRVDFPEFIVRLKELNYQGTLTIEREISGKKQIEDIKKGKKYLETLI